MRALLALLAWFLVGAAALAADASTGSVIGFSKDGRYFAFEQFGRQDGSGFPYAEIFVIDLQVDAWVPGSPFRIRIDDEGATLAAARSAAMTKASPLLHELALDGPSELLAATPATEIAADRRRLDFDRAYWGTPPVPGKHSDRFVLELSELEFPAPANCPIDPAKTLRGFRLSIANAESGVSAVLHTDTSVPGTRGCALGYDIDAVIAPADFAQAPYLVALIGVYAFGFEGQDRRLIAVPVRLP